MAGRIAAEIVSNASARIGHQLARGLEEMSRAEAAAFPGAFKRARGYIEASARNERATLDSVAELVADKSGFARFLGELKRSVTEFETAHLRTIDQAMRRQASGLRLAPVDLRPTPAEKAAAALVPKPLPKIRDSGYQGYQAAIQEARKAAGPAPAAATGRGGARYTAEIQLLCDGKNSALDIKKMLDTQFRDETPLEAVLSHLRLLKQAGLVAF